jgi:lipopolysaccharide export system permease protein
MLVFHACGMSVRQLMMYTLVMGALVSIFVTGMVLINPSIAEKRARLLETSGVKAFIQMLAPQQFQPLPQSQVLYIDEINRGHTKAEGLFLAKHNDDPNQPWQWQVIAAHQLFLHQVPNKPDELVMTKGRVYRLSPGSLKAQYGTFESAQVKIPDTQFNPGDDLRNLSLRTIWSSRTIPSMRAEFQWRISIMLMPLMLAIVAVPLSKVNPRTGKFAKMFPAVIIFVAYVGLLFIWRDQVMNNKWGGNMLVIHLGVMTLGLFLVWRQKRRLS